MSARDVPDPKEVLARLQWVKKGPSEALGVPTEWHALTVELYDALDAALTSLEAAGQCRKCGRPLGSYCIQCAWPHQRVGQRQADA